MDIVNAETKLENKSSISKKTIVITSIGFGVLILIAGGIIFFLLKASQKPIKNYSNPFASHKQTYQNPFSVPTTTYKNPFNVNQNQQKTSQPYQNPFSGGQ